MTAASSHSRFYHVAGLAALIIAGEAVFSLPFHVVRFFRPTVLAVFEISNTNIGQAQATYGVVAMISYFIGGPLADRFPARNLLVAALLTTALGGLYFASIPGQQGLIMLYAFWGGSTILLFWSALIKATREWGGVSEQGRAFGLLEAGRGLLAAVLVSIAVWILGLSLTNDFDQLGAIERRDALQQIIYLYVVVTLLAALLVALFVPGTSPSGALHRQGFHALGDVRRVLGNTLVWPQMLIVLSAYVAYKGVDNYVLYAVQGYGLDEVQGSTVGGMSSWVRPVAAVGAGFLADRWRPSRVIFASFALLLCGYAVFVVLQPRPDLYWLLVSNILISSLAVFALHAIYFALIAESGIPLRVTGTAIGLISVVGFTPDIFVAPAMGFLLDNNSPVAGHQLVFSGLFLFALVGFLSALVLMRQLAVKARRERR
jgi:sugar phosphate permease